MHNVIIAIIYNNIIIIVYDLSKHCYYWSLHFFIRRVLFSYIDDTKAMIENPVFDTSDAYSEPKEDEVMYNAAIS